MRKFKCIKSYGSGEWLTKGKIYTEDNGKFRYDDGWVDTTFDYDSAHFDNDNKVSDYLEEIKEDEKMSKFKVGDKVRVLNNRDCHHFKIGEIVKIECDKVQESMLCKGKDNSYWLSFENIELVYRENNQPKTITITTSDKTTTLTDGTHTTSINRYYTDKHDDMVALEEVVKKYKSEMEEINRVSKLPKVGDRVKVIDDGKVYSMYTNWLITNNVSLESAIKWQCGKFPNNEEKYIIKEIHPHAEFKKDVLALIEDEDNAYIINIKGLEVIK